MKLLLKLLLLSVSLLGGVNRALPQQQTCSPYLLPVAVVAQDGALLKPPELADLDLKSRFAQLKVLSIQPDPRPRRIVILLDASGSMAGQSGSSIWQTVTQFVRHLGSITGPNVSFALIVFSNQILVSVDFSQDRDAVHRKIEAISSDPEFRKKSVRGPTALYDALQAGFHLIANPTSADSLIVITDGGDNVSKVKPGNLLKGLSVSSTRVFCILLSEQHSTWNRTPKELSGPRELGEFVQKAGGDFFGPLFLYQSGQVAMADEHRTSLPISELLIEFYKSMLGNAVITLDATTLSPRPTPLQITFSPPSREKWKGARILYPHLLPPCAALHATRN